MKCLNRVLLINWLHYDKELVDLKTINFFTGNNGAGKSAFLDALQVVLLGETSARNFNKAANDRSERTLDSYLRADRNDNSPRSRRGKDFCSYVVCEFYDETKDDCFVVGIIFECYKNGERKHRFFAYNGEIPKNCYIVEQIALDIDSLKKFVNATGDPDICWTETASKYREYLIVRTNVYDSKFFSLLKKSIALKEVRKIEDFITENVCDVPDPPDIHQMQENIRNYKYQEKLAERERAKLLDLEGICDVFSQITATKQVLVQQEFLVLWGEQEILREDLDQLQYKSHDLKEESLSLEEKITALHQEKEDKESLYQESLYKRDNDDAVKEKKRLDSLLDSLKNQENTLDRKLTGSMVDLKQETETVSALCERILQKSSLFPVLRPLAEQVKDAYQVFLTCNYEIFGNDFEIFRYMEEISSNFNQTIQEIAHNTRQKLENLLRELEEKERNIENLKKNIKSYPFGLTQLRDKLKEALNSSQNGACDVEILADTLDIATGEEGWRGVVEAYMNTQKFYLLISPSHYSEGLRLFQQWKKDFGDRSFGLVDLEKLKKNVNFQEKELSLASKIQTNHNLAREYVDYILGNVICCQSPEEARQHSRAVTQDGLVYQGYVMRNYPKNLMNSAYIGKKAVELQLAQMEEEKKVLIFEKDSLNSSFAPFREEVNRQWLINKRYLTNDIIENNQNFLDLLENRKEQERTVEAIGQCNLYWLAELEEKIKKLQEELKKIGGVLEESFQRRGELLSETQGLEQNQIPSKSYLLREKEEETRRKITEEFKNEIGLPRYAQELARLGNHQRIVTNFHMEYQRQQTKLSNQTEELIKLRQKYSQQYQSTSFSSDPESNESYEEEKATLEESKLPAYASQIKEARESAMEQFQNEFLDKLKSNIDQVQRQVKDLNKALKGTQFGSDSYEFTCTPNPNYKKFYKMIMSDLRMVGDVGIERMAFDQAFETEREELFMHLASADETATGAKGKNISELERNIQMFTDFRTYLNFDMESTDKNGVTQRLSKILATNSGGETQTPFYVAMLASYAQLYKVNEATSSGNTMRLVIFDEAFSKMDSDRIIECVRLLRTLKLQAIMCTPPEKVADIMPEVDQTILFTHQNYHMKTMSYHKKVSYHDNAGEL
ncbi:MAG: SbcC/MukB-like Walker B domain-containing protein [Eubacteriales bacterium]